MKEARVAYEKKQQKNIIQLLQHNASLKQIKELLKQ